MTLAEGDQRTTYGWCDGHRRGRCPACHHFVNATWLREEALRGRIVQLDEAEVHRYRRKREQQSEQGQLWAGVIQE